MVKCLSESLHVYSYHEVACRSSGAEPALSCPSTLFLVEDTKGEVNGQDKQ